MDDSGRDSYRRYLDGDDEGMRELIRDYRDGLILYLTSAFGDIHTAESAAEDAFVTLGIKRPRDKGGASFKTWLYTIGRNAAVDILRRERRHRDTVPLEEVASLAADAAELWESVLREERRRELHKVMSGLSDSHRQVLHLVYFEDFSVKDAAAVMGKSVHATEGLLYRARRALRERLDEEGFEYEEL